MDIAYRILADHVRMIAVCISDGVLPDASPKLRQVVRKVFRVLRNQFGITDARDSASIIFSLAVQTLDSLKYHYPDDDTFETNISIIHSVLEFEADNLVSQEESGRKAMKKLIKVLLVLFCSKSVKANMSFTFSVTSWNRGQD